VSMVAMDEPGDNVGVLVQKAVASVYHYTPLHYLPFIARANALLCKPSLVAAGFPARHLRSKSNTQDVDRGFGTYTHLTLDRHPNILRAKLGAGFPHIKVIVPTEVVEARQYSLCRYNVAMTRFLRRNGKPGFPASPTNGRYYDNHQIPIARTEDDMLAMLNAHLGTETMIEVLIHGDLPLTNKTTVVCYSTPDIDIARRVLTETGSPWQLVTEDSPSPYPRSANYSAAVEQFVNQALANPNWRGNGLEFDRV